MPTQSSVSQTYKYDDINIWTEIGSFTLKSDNIDQKSTITLSRAIYNRSPYNQTIHEDSVYFRIRDNADTTTYFTSADQAYGSNFNIDGTTEQVRTTISYISTTN